MNTDRWRRWAGWLLRLYPRAWQARYANEVRAVLAEHPVTPWTLADLLVGGVDAHLHQHWLPREVFSMEQRLRTSEIAIFAAFVVFMVPWAAAQRIRDPLSDWEAAVRPHPEIRLVFEVLQGAGAVATLAILAGGLPILGVVAGRAFTRRRWDILGLLGVPIGLAILLLGYSLAAQRYWTQTVAPGSTTLTPLAIVLQLVLALLVLGSIVGSAWAVAAAVARGEPGQTVLRLALIPAAMATGAFVVGLAATIVLTILILTEAPALSGPPLGLPLLAALMASAVGIAVASLRRGWIHPPVPIHSSQD